MALPCFSLKVRIFKVGRCLEAQTKISNLWEDARFLTYVVDDEDENSHMYSGVYESKARRIMQITVQSITIYAHYLMKHGTILYTDLKRRRLHLELSCFFYYPALVPTS